MAEQQHDVLSVDLEDLDLYAIQERLETGSFTSLSLVDTYLSRIEQVNDRLHAIANINPDARSLAAERDAQRQEDTIIGPLHGVPILVKDIFITLDSMETTGGSSALVGTVYRQEAFVISRLRKAGAIILGKTNLSQWGMSRSPKCPSGWSGLFGQAVGGFHEEQDPQGSSSGSAIAASLNLASATIGAETCGSILYPAQRNGVVGLKPTVGLTSRSGVIPLNPEQDSVGPLTRWVKDSAIILQAIAGRDESDFASADIQFETVPDYVACCKDSGLRGLRIAVPNSVYQVANADAETASSFRTAIETIKGLGATVVGDIEFEEWRPSGGLRDDLFGDVLLREAFEKFFGELTQNPHNIKNISDLIEYIKAHPEEQYDNFGTDWFDNARDAPGTSQSEEFAKAKQRMEYLGDEVPRLLDRHNCDLLLAMSSTDLPLDLGRLPGISVPLGFYSPARRTIRNSKNQVTKGPNIPFAITFSGRRFSEEKLIGAAYAFEQATKVVTQNTQRLRVQPQSSLMEEACKAEGSNTKL